MDFQLLLGLKPRKSVESKFGIYDGSQFTYSQGNWEAINMITLLYRYGLSITKLDALIGDMLSKFDRYGTHNIDNLDLSNHSNSEKKERTIQPTRQFLYLW